jgi:hypothetical protein
MIEFRAFDPAKDSIDELAAMNEWHPQAQAAFADALRKRFIIPSNAFVAVEDGHIIGAALIMDGGFPFAILDGVYIRPDKRSVEFYNECRKATERYLRERGVIFFFSHVPAQLSHVLVERADYRKISNEPFTLLLRQLS